MENTSQKTSAHTPVPWSVFEDDRPSVFAQIGNENVELCEMSDLQPENERLANGEFIVRACNMHQDLLDVIDGLLGIIVDQNQDWALSDREEEIFDWANALLNQADGKASENTGPATPASTNAESIAEKALDAFWDVIVDHFPNAKTGDLSVERTAALDLATEAAVQEWIGNNVLSQHDDGKIS